METLSDVGEIGFWISLPSDFVVASGLVSIAPGIMLLVDPRDRSVMKMVLILSIYRNLILLELKEL